MRSAKRTTPQTPARDRTEPIVATITVDWSNDQHRSVDYKSFYLTQADVEMIALERGMNPLTWAIACLSMDMEALEQQHD
jgi:hypothetical protein